MKEYPPNRLIAFNSLNFIHKVNALFRHRELNGWMDGESRIKGAKGSSSLLITVNTNNIIIQLKLRL